MEDMDKILKEMEKLKGELEIIAKCEKDGINTTVKFKNGNKICLLYMICAILNEMVERDALTKDDIKIIYKTLLDLEEE